MKITGPFYDQSKAGQPLAWYLRYRIPKPGPNGAPTVDAEGRVVMIRKRPYYKTKDKAEADKPRIHDQYSTAGAGAFIHSREAQAEYEEAKAIVRKVSLVEVARYYRQHHPDGDAFSMERACTLFLEHMHAVHGKSKYYGDLRDRLRPFATHFKDRPATSITRSDVMNYLLGLGASPRSVLNAKRIICTLFNWLVEKSIVTINPAGGIKKRQLPKIVRKEILFLSIDSVRSYLRSCEINDPDLVAHEVIQFFAGVRADDEMSGFRGEWIKPQTREVVVPEEAAKTGVREIISGLEDNFWTWWKRYGRTGVLRPGNYRARWRRVRILATAPPHRAKDLAALSFYALKKQPEWKSAGEAWPWNARRRTFCTYHVAKHQSADRTQLILRQRGEASTLHNSYRGLGITQKQGVEYFKTLPLKNNSR